MTTYSKEKILEFLDKMANDGRMPANTANSQKTAVVKICEALDEPLSDDIDVEDLIQRFHNKAKTELNADSLRIYGTRFKAAFNGFLEWNTDPSNYKPKIKRGRPLKTSCHDTKTSLCSNAISQPIEKTGTSSQLNANYLVKYPLITSSIRGSLEIPEKLLQSDIDRLIPLVTEIIKSHGKICSPNKTEKNIYENV